MKDIQSRVAKLIRQKSKPSVDEGMAELSISFF